MRICLYTETALPKLGGQELVVDALARNLLELGHQPVVLAQRPRGHWRVDDSHLPYPVVRHPRFWSTHRFVAWYRHWLLRLHRRQGFDVLHCHSVYPCGYLAALSREQLGTPVVITSHGGDVHAGNARLRKHGLPERFALALRSADALVAISRFTANAFQALSPQLPPIAMIPNGVDLAPFAQRPERPPNLSPRIRAGEYLFFLGRLHRRKGIDVLLDAVAILRQRHPQVQLVVAGDGDERPSLEAQVERLGLSEHVVFVGSVRGETKTWLLQNSRCQVVASREWESFGLVVIEAFAAGRPAVVSDLPGMSDLITPEQTGSIVPRENAPALAAALAPLLADSALADRWGQTARAAVAQYDWRTVTQRHVELFESLLAASCRQLAA
jgi:glycosyltransferase involved in cell wall biosynthesis